MTPHRDGFRGPRMVALAFVLMNVAIGLTYGAFGALVLPLEAHFDTTRSLISLAISLVILNSGLLAPVIGALIGRFSIRKIMLLGAVLASLGYLALAFAQNALQMLLCFAFLIGPGMALLGPLPCYTLVSNWYVRGQGVALGIINMPILVMLLPVLVVAVLPGVGLQGVLLLLAAGYLLAVPLVLAVVDRPENIGQQPQGADQEQPSIAPTVPDVTFRMLFKSPSFLFLIVGSGLIVGAGVAKTVHMMPLLTEMGWETGRAAILLSISGGTGIIGALLFGWMADRFNAGVSLMMNGLVQAVVWLILISPASFGLLVVDAILIGVCGGGFISAKGVLVSRLYGSANFAPVMGASGFATLPFLFGMAPLAGLMREWLGDYRLAVLIYIAGFVIAACCFALLGIKEKARNQMSKSSATL